MVLRKLLMLGVVAASAVAVLPVEALAGDGHRHGRHHRHHHHHYDDDHRGHRYYRERGESRGYYERRSRDCRTSGTTGLIVGGAAGALLGREIDRSGDRAPGTIIGAGAGALLGREIDRKNRC